MPDNISALYGALKKNDFQVPENEDDFRKAIQNPKIVNELHSALKQNDFQVPESVNDFSNWLNPTPQEVKKKEETPSTSGGAYVRPLLQGGGEPAQSFSQATLGRLSDEQFRARKEAEANRQKAIEKEQARVRKEQFYSNVKPIAQSTAEDIDLFAPNNSLPSTGEIYQTLKQIEINKAKGFQYKPKPITQPLASDVTKTTITPRLTATLSEEERNRQLALKGKEKEEETSLTETKEEATPLQKTLTLASNVAKGAVGVGRDFAQVGDLLIRKGIENTFEGEPKKYKPEVQGIIDRVRGYNLQRGDEAFEKDLGQYFYEHPEYKTSDVAQTARGLGQVIPSVVVGLLTGGTGVFAQTAIQGTLSGTQIFNEAYKRAKEYGTDDETAIKTAFLDAVGESYVDAFPTLKLLNRFNKTVGGGFWNKAKQSAKEAGVAFVEGGTSEGLQKIVSNAIASYNYDDNVALLDDVFEEGKIGGFTQSLLSLGLSAIKHARVKAKTPQQKAELDKKEASLYDAMKSQNIASPPMDGEAIPPSEGGAPSPTPPVGGTDIAVEETLEDKKAKAGESLRNLLGKVATEEKIVTPQGEEPLVEGNTPEEIATNIQVKLNDIKTQRAKILGGLPKDENGKRIKNAEAQSQLDDLEEQEFRLQEYDSQNKQRVSGEVGEGQKPVEAQPVGAGSEEAVAPNRIFQTPTQEVIIPDTPAGHVTAVMENPTTTNVQNLADNAVSLAQEVIRQGNDQGTIPQEKMPTLEETTPIGKEPKESVVGGDVESKKKSFIEAGEQSKKDQSLKALGNFIIDNAQVGDRIKINEDQYYEVVSRRVSKRNGSTEVELQNFIKNEETGNFENNPSAVKIFTDKYRGTDLEKLGYTAAADLFETSYTNLSGEKVIEQSTYEPKVVEQTLKETPVAENIQNAVTTIENKEAVELQKLPPVKEPLKNKENTEKALKRFSSQQLSEISIYNRDIIVKMIDAQLKKTKQALLSTAFPEIYDLPSKTSTIKLNEKGEVELLDKNEKKISGKKITKDQFIDIAIQIGKNQTRKDASSISEAYHADKAAGKETELTKAVEQLLGKPISDVQGEGKRSILGSDVDLKGKKKEGWMKLLDEWYNDKLASEGEQTTNEVQKFSDMLPKNPLEFASLKQHKDLPIVKDIIEHQKTVKNNILKINNAISEGSMTAQDAKTIIESAGLEVPKNILEMAKKESKSTSTTGQKASTETISEGWDKDVESTAKALDDVLSNKEVKVDKAKLKKVNNEISKLIDIDNKEPKLKKIKEQGGNWRKLFNESKDTVSQNSILRAVVETSNDVNFLNEAVDITNGLPDESNTIADILQKNISDNNKAEIVKKVLSGDYKKNTKFDVLNWLEYNKGIKRLIPKDLLKKFEVKSDGQLLSEAYHKAKADGSNPELVKAVEQLLGKPTEAPKAKAEAPKNEATDALKDVESTAKALEGKTAGLLKEPTLEQKIEDLKNKNISTFRYEKDSDVPFVLKDKISSRSETNGKQIINVTLSKSEANYLLNKDNPQYISEEYHADKAAGKETELTKAVEKLLGKPTEAPKVEAKPSEVTKEPAPQKESVVGGDVVGKTFRDNYNRTFEVKYENAGILTLEDVDTGKVLRKKKNEVLSNFKEIAENDNNNEQYINLINKVGKNEELTKDDIRTKMDMQDKQPYEYDKDVFDKLYSVSIKTAGNDKGIILKNKVTGETNWIHASDLGFFGRMLGKESIMTPEVFKKVFQEKNKKAALDIAYKNKIEEAEYQKSKKTPKVEQALKETPQAETIEDKKAKAGESLRNLLGKTGVIKNIVPSEDSDTWNDIKNIADYIAAETGKKGKELIEAIKKYLKTNGGEAIIPQIETYEKRIIAESSQEGVETTKPTNIRIFEELDAINEKRMGIGNRAKENKAFNEKHGNKAQLARDITNNFEKYIDKLKEEGIIVKVKC